MMDVSEEYQATWCNKNHLHLDSLTNRISFYCLLICFTTMPMLVFDIDTIYDEYDDNNNYETNSLRVSVASNTVALINSLFTLVTMFQQSKLKSPDSTDSDSNTKINIQIKIAGIIWIVVSICSFVSIIMLYTSNKDANDGAVSNDYCLSYAAVFAINNKINCFYYYFGRYLILCFMFAVIGGDLLFRYGNVHYNRVFSMLFCLLIPGYFEWQLVEIFTHNEPLDKDIQWDIVDTGWWFIIPALIILLVFYYIIPLVIKFVCRKQDLYSKMATFYSANQGCTGKYIWRFVGVLLFIGAALSTANPVLNMGVLNTQYIYLALCIVVAIEIQ